MYTEWNNSNSTITCRYLLKFVMYFLCQWYKSFAIISRVLHNSITWTSINVIHFRLTTLGVCPLFYQLSAFLNAANSTHYYLLCEMCMPIYLQAYFSSNQTVIQLSTWWDKVTGRWESLHNEELRNLHSLPNIIRVIKQMRKKWVKCVAHTKEKFIQNFSRKIWSKVTTWETKCRWKWNIKMKVKEVVCEGVDRICVA
jgi:hypothetical protein